MNKEEDKSTRYFIDVDLKEQKILGWDYDQKETLILEKSSDSHIHRIYISKGQYNKLDKKQEVFLDSIGGNIL
jgi:hypothetical protein